MRALLLVCADPDERQFAGLRRLLPRLEAGIPGLAWRQWRGRALSFRRHRRLGPVLISGHGAADRAAFRSPFGCLTPALLRLPRGASLYLLGCHQGRAELRRAWAAGTGTAEERVRGQAGETESAFSTCLLLHLLEDGLPGLDGWFAAWQRCNAELAGHLPLLRDAYARCGADPLRAWEQLRCLPALQAHRSFLGAGLRHPEYLSGLA